MFLSSLKHIMQTDSVMGTFRHWAVFWAVQFVGEYMGELIGSQSKIGTYLLALLSIIFYPLFTLSKNRCMVYFSALKDF